MFPNLAARADTAAGVLSGGEKQMLTTCRTLMGDPDLIMIDEPTEGLAPLIVQQVGDLIARDRAGRRRHPAGRAETVDRDAHLARASTSWATAASCSKARRTSSRPMPPYGKEWLEV